MPDPVPLSAAAETRVEAATAVAAAQEATTAEAVETVADAAIERAQDAVAEAEATADAIALAAMQTAIGQQLAAESTARKTWQDGHDQLHLTLLSEIATVKTRMEEIAAQMTEAINRLPPIVAVSSTPAASPATETTIVAPGNESAAPMPAESAVPAAKRRIRFL